MRDSSKIRKSKNEDCCCCCFVQCSHRLRRRVVSGNARTSYVCVFYLMLSVRERSNREIKSTLKTIRTIRMCIDRLHREYSMVEAPHTLKRRTLLCTHGFGNSFGIRGKKKNLLSALSHTQRSSAVHVCGHIAYVWATSKHTTYVAHMIAALMCAWVPPKNAYTSNLRWQR